MKANDQQGYLQMVGRISFFAAVSYAVDYSFQLIDMYWVSKLGAAAPTAITLVSVIILVTFTLNEIAGVGSVSLISQSFGRGDDAATGRLIVNCLAVKFVLGLAMVVLFVTILAATIWWQGLDGPLRQMTLDYAWVIWPSLVLVPVYVTVMNVLRTVGLEFAAAMTSVMILAVNAIVTPLLVLGYGEIPGLGIAGAAWATILSQALALAVSFAVLVRKRPALNLLHNAAPGWQPVLYRKLLVIGIPIGVMMMVYSMENLILANIMLDYPVAVSDGFGIGARIFGFAFIVNIGITVGVSIATGRTIGSSNALTSAADTVSAGTNKLCLYLLLFGLVVWASTPLWLDPVLAGFTDNPATAETAAGYIRVMLATNCLFMATYALHGVFQGAGVTWPILVAGLVSYVAIEFPLFYTVHYFAPENLTLLWSAITIAAAIGLAISLYYFRLRIWNVKQIATGDEACVQP